VNRDATGLYTIQNDPNIAAPSQNHVLAPNAETKGSAVSATNSSSLYNWSLQSFNQGLQFRYMLAATGVFRSQDLLGT
jgi:hypothetical protein